MPNLISPFRIGRDDLLGCCVVGRESPTKDGRQQWSQCFAGIQSSNDSAPQIPHSASMVEQFQSNSHFTNNQYDSNFLLGSTLPKMSISCYGEDSTEVEMSTLDVESGRRGIYTKNSPSSGKRGSSDGVRMAVGVWHSILGEVPEGFKNIPKAKKK